MSLRNFFIFLFLGVLIYNCSPDDSPSGFDANFDHAAQALIDKDSINMFLQSYFYNEMTETLKMVENNETSLSNDPRLDSLSVSVDDVEYSMYYLTLREGSPDPIKENPTFLDSVLVVYRGERIVTNDSLFEFERRVSPIWLVLNSAIRGWSNGIPNYKGGRNITTNGPIEFENGGKGVLIIPSGLAYRNLGTSGTTIATTIPANANLVFHFELYDHIEGTDHDGDSIIAIKEDIDGDGDPNNDDTDGDILPDYLDLDDDGDGIATRDEVENNIYTEDNGGNNFSNKQEAQTFFNENAAANEILYRIQKDSNGNYIIYSTILTNTNNTDIPDLPDYLDPTVAVSNQ